MGRGGTRVGRVRLPFPPEVAVITRTAPGLAAGLLAYCRRRLGATDLHFLHPPEEETTGWEAYTFRFQLWSRRGLPAAFRRPLALRLHAGPEYLPRLRREYHFQRRLARCGYPAPRPLLREEDAALLGGPFLLTEWVEGETLLALLRRQTPSILWAPSRMAETHARLHCLPAADFPRPARPFLDRQFDELEAVISACGLGGLRPGLAWLCRRRPSPGEPPGLLHLDFHPGNLLMHAGRCAAVLDWGDADVGDRHADVAYALLMIETAPVDQATTWDRLSVPVGRWLLRQGYLAAYRRLLPLDPGRLRYYQAWAALRRLAVVGQWLHAGPESTGYRPDVLRRVRPDYVATMERYFRRRAGVAVRLGLPPRPPRAGAVRRAAAG
jgi:aminoglycoside phosphotransferase (APT) family kinase protein